MTERLGDMLRPKTSAKPSCESGLDTVEANAMPDAVVLFDLEGTIQEVNEAFTSWLGESRPQLIGASLWESSLSAIGIIKRAQVTMVAASGEPAHHVVKHDRGWTDITISPLFGPEGGVTSLAVFMRDITHQRRTEDELQRSQTQLFQSQKLEALGMLVAGVAHEINNPINLITFNIPLLRDVWQDLQQVMAEQAKLDPDRKYGGLPYPFLEKNFGQLIADIDMAASRVAHIIRQLKDFARSSDLMDKKPVSLNRAMENAVRLARTTIRKSGISLDVNPGLDLPLMKGNIQNLEQVILNLLLNACQAIDHDHGRVEIHTGYEKDGQRLFLTLSDNGRGIDPAVAPSVFDPFFTTRQDNGGTGLGLSVSYSLVKAHGGEIRFDSQPDERTTFYACFPAITGNRNILVADDETPVREIIARILNEDDRNTVTEASNGEDALIKLGVIRPDLLILDIFMPHIDGLEVCRAIKSEPALASVKVLIITGQPNHPKTQQVIEMGFDQMLVKPFSNHELNNRVREMLED